MRIKLHLSFINQSSTYIYIQCSLILINCEFVNVNLVRLIQHEFVPILFPMIGEIVILQEMSSKN